MRASLDTNVIIHFYRAGLQDMPFTFADILILRYLKRFWKNPYRKEDLRWMQELVTQNGIAVKTKFVELQKLI